MTTITTQTGATFHVNAGQVTRTDPAAPQALRSPRPGRLVRARVGEPARVMFQPAGEDVWGHLITAPVTQVLP